jgi:hypothetical protein
MRLIILWIIVLSATANAVEKPKFVFIKSHCAGPLGEEILASFRQEVRASAGYQLATALTDDGGYDVVITAYVTCVESTLPSSERVVSVASIFGTGTCTAGSCSTSSNEPTLQAMLCSGKSGAGCGKDLYVSLDDYMSKEGGYIFRELSDSRKKALGN